MKVEGMLPWGKTVYHAEISKSDAKKLEKLPCWWVLDSY